jgi:uncharacterized protein (DUF1330 family)
MRKLSPTVEEIEALRRTVPPGPVVMVNLLKFKPDGGREAYAKYLQATTPVVPPGMRILYSGKAGADVADGEDWDFVGIAEYPSFKAFADMVVSPTYQIQAIPIRPAALEKTLLMISQPADVSELFSPPSGSSNASKGGFSAGKLSPTVEEIEALRLTEPLGPVVMVNLLKFKPDGGREAYVKYLQAASSAIPSSYRIVYCGKAGADLGDGEDWDFVILVEYPSFTAFADMAASPTYQHQAIPFRPAALEKTLFMVSHPVDSSELFNPH